MATSIASFTLSDSPSVYTATQTATVSWSAGDKIVVGGIGATGARAIGVPTATGLTFTSTIESDGSSSTAEVEFFTADAAASGTNVQISVTASGTTDPWCFGVWVVTGNPGAVGNTSQTWTTVDGTSTARSLTTAAGEIVLLIESDWLAASGGQTLTTGSGTSTLRDNTNVSTQYTAVFGDWVGTSATTASYGSTSYSGRRCATAAIVIGASTFSLDQDAFRWGNDDGSESAHTWAAAEDTNLTAALGSKLLRLQIEATGDPSAEAFSLRYQKNGAGGYVPVPVGASTETTPVIEAGDTTSSGDNATTPTSPWPVSRPTAATGDLLIMIIGWDDSTSNTGVTVANGPNGEVWTQIGSVVASNTTEVRLTAYWVKATGTWSAGSISVTPAANEQWTATVIKVLAGEFDDATPIGANATLASTGTAETSVLNPDLSVGSTDGGGKLVWAGCVDADPLVTLSSGYTSIANNDRGQVALGVAVRDTAVTDSESVTDGTWSIASDSWCSIAFIVRAPTVTNQVYISASSNITAGGEATTARLTAPAGKSTSDFTTGRRWDNENGTDTIDIVTDDYTEVEWSLTTQAPAAASDYFDFRVYADGVALNTYTATPRWTIDPDVDASAGEAAATAAAQAAAAKVSPNAGAPSATATAHDATTSSTGGNKWDAQTHDFPGSAIDGTFWPGSYGTAPTVSGNKLSWGAGADYSGRATVGYDLIDSSVLIKYDPVTTGGYSGSHLKADAADTNIAAITYDSGSGMLNGEIAGSNWSGSDSSNNVSLPASSLWVRYRHASGTLYLEYSVGGTSWTTLHSAATTGAMDTALADSKLLIECGPFNSAITSGPAFAKLNLPPTATDADAGQATATATAQPAAASVGPAAGQASATAAAQQPSVHVAPSPATATAAATAQQPSVHVQLGAGQAAATATAHDASVWIEAHAGEATATAAGQQPSAGVGATAGEATAIAVGQPAAASLAVTAGEATASAAAHDATGSSSINATAGEATTSATAWLASTSLAVQAGEATAAATAHDATTLVGQSGRPDEAAATATAEAASVRVAPTGGQAASTAAAQPASVSLAASAGQAAGTATAQPATASLAPAAGEATGTAAAHDAAIATAVTPTAGEAQATATAQQPAASIAPTAGSGSATATAHNPSVDVGAPKWDDQTVDFDNAPGDIFTTSGNAPTYIGNKARWDMGATDGQLRDFTDRDLTESYVAIRAEPNPSYGYLEFQIAQNSGATIIGSVYKLGNTNVLNIFYNGSVRATPTWDATAMAWWRWRVASGTLYLETSPNGGYWTEQWSEPTAGATFDLTTVEVVFNGGNGVGGAAPAPGVDYAYISKFNILPPAANVPAELAEATAAAHNATIRTDSSAHAGHASATATAYPATVDNPTARPGEAAATGSAHPASIAIAVGAGEAAGTATAHDATISTALAKWGQVTNDFSDFIGDNFTYSGSIDASDYVGNRCRYLVQGVAEGQLRDFNDRDLTGSSISLYVEPHPSYGYVELQITQNAGVNLVGSAFKRADQAWLTVFYNGSTVATPTYNPDTMKYWRWREDAGTLYFEVGYNGVNFTTLWSDATAGTTFDLTQIEVVISGGGIVGGSAPDEQYAYVSRFNIAPNGAPAELATATATAHDATASTLNAGDVPAQVATVTATAHFDVGASISLSMVADAPISTPAVAHDATVRTDNNPPVGQAAATATAHDATVSTVSNTQAQAGEAQATATAHNATVSIGSGPSSATSGEAAATATAHNASVATTSASEALAGDAAATATAHNAAVQLGQRPARLTATTTIYAPTFSARFTQPTHPIATTTIPAPTVRATATATPARATATAQVFVPGISMRASAPYIEATTSIPMPTPAEAQFVLVQVWNGSTWMSGVLNVWNGSEWKPGSLRVFLAGTWQPT